MIQAGQTAAASDFVSSSSGAGDSGKVPKLDAAGKLLAAFLPYLFKNTSAGAGDAGKGPLLDSTGQLDKTFIKFDLPVVRTYVTSNIGNTDTRFTMTKVSNTIRYTYTGTGTNPNISAATFPVGTPVQIYSHSFNGNNNGNFIVTASGANYFEVTNAAGVAESDKTMDANFILMKGSIWTKPAGLKYIEVELVDGGNGGVAGKGGMSGAYARKLIAAADLAATMAVMSGAFGLGAYYAGGGWNGSGRAAGISYFGTLVDNTHGDLLISGQDGDTNRSGTSSQGGNGGSNPLGFGGVVGTGPTGYGGGGCGWNGDGYGAAGNGTGGIVIVKEFYN
jgi:hypothetical protein